MLKSSILKSPHGFSDRWGGVSKDPHTATLNLAFGRGDDDSVVLENLKNFAREVGFDPMGVVSLPQIHSDRIYKAGKDDCGKGYFIRENPDGTPLDGYDGYITSQKGVVLGIKTADCVPVLFEAEKNGEIIAVGAVHAGWRGTLAGIAPKCAEMLCLEYGVSPEHVRASIGPCIHSCCFEVGGEVMNAFAEHYDRDFARQFFAPVEGKPGKFMCDLPQINRTLLLLYGIQNDNIKILPHCTCCLHDRFFSHRYTGGVRGTMLNVIFMK